MADGWSHVGWGGFAVDDGALKTECHPKGLGLLVYQREKFVGIEGQRVTSFDPESPDVPRDRQWFEPKREPKRPEVGYLGLQNHDPGDVVWFREISVRPLTDSGSK